MMTTRYTDTISGAVVGPAGAAEESPFVRPAVFSRRSVLGAFVAVGLAATIDSSPLGSWTAIASPPKIRAGLLPNAPTPYSVSASSELADEVIATSEVIVGTDARVWPFVNTQHEDHPDGLVEAVVVSGNTLAHLRRDSTSASGWTYAPLVSASEEFQRFDSVAVAARGDVVTLLAFGIDNYGDPAYLVVSLSDTVDWKNGVIYTASNMGWPTALNPLKAGVTTTGLPFFYAWFDYANTSNLWTWIADPHAPLKAQGRLSLSLENDSQASIVDALVFWDDTSTSSGFAMVVNAAGELARIGQDGGGFSILKTTFLASREATQVLWANSSGSAWACQFGERGTRFFDGSENVDFIDHPSADGRHQVAVWARDGRYTVSFLDSDGTLHILEQQDANDWATAIPISRGAPGSSALGLVSVFDVPSEATQSTLFVVGADETFSVLTLDDGGWTQTQVHQDHVVGMPVKAYRLKMQMVDANRAAVPYGQIRVTSDRPVGLWQDTGSTIITPGTPAVMTADLYGHVNANILAEELDAPVLTVQALDIDDQPSGTAIVVAADTDLRSFLGGTAPLNKFGTLSADTLTSAVDEHNNPLLPGLSQSDASNTVATFGKAIAAGNGEPSPPAGAVRAYRLHRTENGVKLTTSSDTHAFDKFYLKQGALGGSLLGDLRHIGHAIRHGAAAIQSAVVRAAHDGIGWAIDIALAIDDDIKSFYDLAITEMRDAFHVIGGWLATLGADIKAAVTWLAREVLGIFEDVKANADTIQSWLDQASDKFGDQITTLGTDLKSYFQGKEQQAQDGLAALATSAGDVTFKEKQPSAGDGTSGSSAALQGLKKDAGLLFRVINDSPGKWLYDKLSALLPGDSGPDFENAFESIMDGIVAAFVDDVADAAERIAQAIYDLLKAGTNPDGLTQQQVDGLFTDLSGLINDLFMIADAVADGVSKMLTEGMRLLDDYLRYEWQWTSLNPVLKLIFDKLGFDGGIAIGHILSLLVGFVTTLVRDAMGDGRLESGTGSLAELRDDPPADSNKDALQGLYTAAAITQGIWSGADVLADLEKLAKPGTEGPDQSLAGYIDIIAPILTTLLTFPGAHGGPFWSGSPSDNKKPGLIPWMTASALAPSILGFALALMKKQFHYEPPQENVLPLYTSYAALNLGFSAAFNVANATTRSGEVVGILGAVFGNLSNLCSGLTDDQFNEDFEQIPMMVKLAVDVVAGGGGCVVLFDQAGGF